MPTDDMPRVQEISDGDVKVWIEQECIHLAAVDPHGDPIELTVDEALQLARVLERLAALVED